MHIVNIETANVDFTLRTSPTVIESRFFFGAMI